MYLHGTSCWMILMGDPESLPDDKMSGQMHKWTGAGKIQLELSLVESRLPYWKAVESASRHPFPVEGARECKPMLG